MAAVEDRWLTALALGSAMALLTTQPAAALTAELAKTCRSMAIKAHPTARPGSATGSAQAQRDYFRKCVDNNGKMPDDAASQTPK